jgi:putative transposase
VPFVRPVKIGIPVLKIKRPDRKRWMNVDQDPDEILISLPEKKIVAIDPGIRTFATLYDPDGYHYDWAPGDHEKLRLRCLKIDRLISQIDKKLKKDGTYIDSNRKKRMKKALNRMRQQIQNLRTEVHRNVVLLPKFETSQMVAKRSRRKLKSKTARAMLNWSHYSFKQRLNNKAAEYGTQIIECTEEYTSKTCGMCGSIHEKLGGNKTFVCPSCKWIVDRDLNGARNIFLKWIMEYNE